MEGRKGDKMIGIKEGDKKIRVYVRRSKR